VVKLGMSLNLKRVEEQRTLHRLCRREKTVGHPHNSKINGHAIAFRRKRDVVALNLRYAQ